jgi:hypothetical protein
MNEKTFKTLSLQERLQLVRSSGEFIGNRQSGEHFVSLFAVEGLLIEVWMPVGLNCARYIEIQKSDAVLSDYYQKVSLKSLGV